MRYQSTVKIIKSKIKILNLFSRFSLNINGSDDFRNDWTTSFLNDCNKIKTKSLNGKTCITITGNKSQHFYLLHKIKPKFFKKIRPFDGIECTQSNQFKFCLYGKNDHTLYCRLLILEYNGDGVRTNVIRLELNQSFLLTPSNECTRIALAVEVKGYGSLQIDSLLAIKSLINPTTARSNEIYFPEDKTFVTLEDAKNKLMRIKEDAGKEVYIWKRRALAWEEKAKSNSNLGNSSMAHSLLLNMARSLPISNGSRYYKKLDIKVAIISDVYMYNFYKDAFKNVSYLSPTNYKEILAAKKFDFILYVSCWRGLEDDEWRGVKYREAQKAAFEEIINIGKKNQIKLVFQTIEDPSNYDYFLPLAKKFDYIFTSAIECISEYKSDCNNENVFYGEYGISPFLHNPIGCRKFLLDRYFFAGSWTNRYEERCHDIKQIFKSVIDSKIDLVVADRNFGSENEDLRFPEEYNDNLLPPFEHKILQSIHKLFKKNLNFNSIKHSASMCAMRVYEMQAMGTGIISNYAKSVYNKFPEIDILNSNIDLSNNNLDAKELSLQDYRRNMRALRNVYNGKTVFDISRNIIEKLHLDVDVKESNNICIICESPSDKNRIGGFKDQVINNKIFALKSDFRSKESWDKFKAKNNIKYFTFFSDRDEYEKFYLLDLLNGFKYTNVDFVTKDAYYDCDGKFIRGIEHDYVAYAKSKFRTLFSAKNMNPSDLIDYKYYQIISKENLRGYSIDPFELNYYKNRSFSNDSRNEDKILSVIVPVYNNGKFLVNNAIKSLLRNKNFPSFEIILVDDASTDMETIDILGNLEREFNNVVKYTLKGTPSGSASVPRNKGIELASASLVAFLDPDNEICPRGYDKLLELYEEINSEKSASEIVPLVSGFHLKVGESVNTTGKHTHEDIVVIENPKNHFLKKGKFIVMPTQPAVINKEFLIKNNIKFVEGAAGQDTLYGWTILAHANSIGFTGSAYITYYSERSDSIVNDIDIKYFEKKLVLEKKQIGFLKTHSLLNSYKDKHLENFMNNWYKKKIDTISDMKSKIECQKIVQKIENLYK